MNGFLKLPIIGKIPAFQLKNDIQIGSDMCQGSQVILTGHESVEKENVRKVVSKLKNEKVIKVGDFLGHREIDKPRSHPNRAQV
jgi:hypothetical protein